MNILKKIKLKIMLRKLEGVTVYDAKGREVLAKDYVASLPERHREIATESILQNWRRGVELNNVEITSLAREMKRKRLGIK